MTLWKRGQTKYIMLPKIMAQNEVTNRYKTKRPPKKQGNCGNSICKNDYATARSHYNPSNIPPKTPDSNVLNA